MALAEVVGRRRAYRAMDKMEIGDDTVHELVEAARLSASCFNNQLWNFIFVRSQDMLEKMKDVMSKGNERTFRASMIAAVFSKEDDDCVIEDHESSFRHWCGHGLHDTPGNRVGAGRSSNSRIQ
ncbi:MAG: nitroreductase family protein [Thermoplasmata archaeon]